MTLQNKTGTFNSNPMDQSLLLPNFHLMEGRSLRFFSLMYSFLLLSALFVFVFSSAGFFEGWIDGFVKSFEWGALSLESLWRFLKTYCRFVFCPLLYGVLCYGTLEAGMNISSDRGKDSLVFSPCLERSWYRKSVTVAFFLLMGGAWFSFARYFDFNNYIYYLFGGSYFIAFLNRFNITPFALYWLSVLNLGVGSLFIQAYAIGFFRGDEISLSGLGGF